MSRCLLTVAAVFACLGANAATWFNWKGGDGNWSDKSHWDEGRVPVSGDIVIQFKAGTVATINMDTNVTCNYFQFQSNASAGKETAVRLVGTGSLRTTATTRCEVYACRRMIVDGPTVSINKHIAIATNAAIEIRSGAFGVSNGTYVYGGGTLLVGGGRYSSSLYLQEPGAALSVTGGVLHTYSGFDVSSGALLNFRGGVLEPESAFPTSGYSLNIESDLDVKTSKSLTLGSVSVAAGATLSMTNSTGTITATKVTLGDGAAIRMTSTLRRCEELGLGEGALVDMPKSSGAVMVRTLAMGANSRMNLAAGEGFVEPVLAPTLDETAKIVFTVPESGLTAHTLLPVWSSDMDSVPPNVEIVGLDEDAWTVKTVCGVRYLSDGYDPGVSYAAREWIGTNSSTWSVKANWSGESVLNGSSYGYFGRDLNPFVTNDAVRSIRYPIFMANAGPYFIGGKQLSLTYGDNSKDTSNTLRDLSPFPVVFDNYIVAGSAKMAYFRNVSNSFLLMRGGGKIPGAAAIHGDVRFGGVWTATNILYNADTTRASRMTVAPSGTFTLTRHDGTLAAPKRLDVFGTFETSNTLSTVANTVNWRGTGVVKIHGVSADAAGAFTLGDSLTLYPMDGWRTVPASDPSNAVTIAVTETPVLGATRDWTYGPEEGAVPTMTESERALTVAADATLTIDTQDPETSEGHVITLADPIAGDGNVVKAGAGTLLFATTSSVIKGAFRVAGGGVAVSDDIFAAADGAWTPILRASSAEGVAAALPTQLKCRVRETEDGLVAVEIRQVKGSVLIIL